MTHQRLPEVARRYAKNLPRLLRQPYHRLILDLMCDGEGHKEEFWGEPFNIVLSWLVHLRPILKTSPFTVPLYEALIDPVTAVDCIVGQLAMGWSIPYRGGAMMAVGGQLSKNLPRSRDGPVMPSDSNLEGRDLVEGYLAGTPFYDFLMTPVPLPLPERFDHHFICAGSGAGKTSTIEHLLLHDFRDPAQPSVVVIDPTSDLINRILAADLGLDDRIIYITPSDIGHPPAVNVFAPNARLGRYDQAVREQVSAGVIETFEYLFSGLFDLALTGRQSYVFRYIARLMLSFPETMNRPATIQDMIDLTDDKQFGKFSVAIERLPEAQRAFFQNDFIPQFRDTRTQIRGRLQAIVGEPQLERLFKSPETRIDLFTELNRGSIVLIDTSATQLGRAGSAVFGRLWVSLILQAILERAAIPEADRTPTYLYIDEAFTLFDEKLAALLREVRKYRCGAVLAAQELPPISTVRSSISANTGIKMVCRPAAADASSLAADMRTTRDFLLAQPKLTFATYTEALGRSVAVPIKPGTFAKLPKRDPSEFLEKNRARVAVACDEPAAIVSAESPQSTGLDYDPK